MRPVAWLTVAVLAVLVIVGVVPADERPASASVPLSVKVVGNQLVNGSGDVVRLLGVDVPGTEYACEEGWGDSDVPISQTSAEAIAAWGADAVRVPLNEDCWLGINGEPAYGTTTGYQQAIEAWVADLHAAGLYVILDLHWSAPGTLVADGQRPMPDDHSAAFWSSVASTFRTDPAVVFDAFNEPYSPLADGDSSLAVSWSCWENGGCAVPVARDGTPPDAQTYPAVGMQALVNAIRSTGASQPIMLGGLSYANDLSEWLANEPTDPDGQLVASLHTYQGNTCDTVSCWNAVVAPVAARVPVVAGEFDQGYDCAGPPAGSTGAGSFDNTFMDWADAHGVSYLAWGWYNLTNSTDLCSGLSGGGSDNYALISNDTTGAAVAPDGTNLRAHLLALAATAPPPPTTTPPTPAPPTTSPPTTAPSPTCDQRLPSGSVVGMADSAGADGYWIAARTGQVAACGAAPDVGQLAPPPASPVVAIAATPDGGGFWLATAAGQVLPFGDAVSHGQVTGGLNRPIVAMAADPATGGYWLLGADGGVFSFDAPFYGSTGNIALRQPAVGMVATANGSGYYFVASDGGVFAYHAPFDGSEGGTPLNRPVVGMALDPATGGYWLDASDGGIFSFDAPFAGSAGGLWLNQPCVSMAADPTSQGYRFVAADGGVFSFDAPFEGSAA
jgi:endoglucanase